MACGKKKIGKQDRKNAKGWAEGVCAMVLNPLVNGYANTKAQGQVQERQAWHRICDEFHAKIPWRLQDHEEPPLPLPDYDPKNPPPVEVLEGDELRAEQSKKASTNLRICTWMNYHVTKIHRAAGKQGRAGDDPFALLLELSKDSYDTVVDPELKHRLEADGSIQNMVKWCNKVTRELFKALLKDKQKSLLKKATDVAVEAKEKYKTALKTGPLKKPEDHQKCLNNLASFFGPILHGANEYTGHQFLLVSGGPTPKLGGEIRTKNIAIGTELETGLLFSKWKVPKFEAGVIGFYKEYLQGAYTDDEKERLV
ncbi:hypothetical protein C8J56DRAFT_1044518 [Mycena floridula]|nr:hypothetical protein C8J56DRAFT_1044518 [Mycena floridula]